MSESSSACLGFSFQSLSLLKQQLLNTESPLGGPSWEERGDPHGEVMGVEPGQPCTRKSMGAGQARGASWWRQSLSKAGDLGAEGTRSQRI